MYLLLQAFCFCNYSSYCKNSFNSTEIERNEVSSYCKYKKIIHCMFENHTQIDADINIIFNLQKNCRGSSIGLIGLLIAFIVLTLGLRVRINQSSNHFPIIN